MYNIKRLNVLIIIALSQLIISGLANAASYGCHIVDGSVSNNYTSSFAIQCSQDVDLTQHYIQVQLPSNTHSYSHPWSSDINAPLTSHSTQDNKLLIRAGKQYSGNNKDFILSTGKQATIKFNYDSPPSKEDGKPITKDNLNLQIIDAPALKGSVKITKAPKSSNIPMNATIDLNPTSQSTNKSYHFTWQQVKNQTQPIQIGEYQISAQYRDKHLITQPSSVTIKNKQTSLIKINYHPYPNEITLHLHQTNPQGTRSSIKINLTDETDNSSSLIDMPWNTDKTISNLKTNHTYHFNANDIWGYNQHISFNFSPQTIKTNSSQNQYDVAITPQKREIATHKLQLNVSGLPSNQTTQITFAARGKIIAQKLIKNGSIQTQLPTGLYRVKAQNVINDGKKYSLSNQTIVIKPEGSNKLKLHFTCQPAGNAVSNWPSYIAMGAISNAQISSHSLDGKNVDAIFKYAGVGGDGDPGKVLLPVYTYKTIQTAKNITQTNNHLVKPVMVVYTAQMSGGTAYQDLYDQDKLTKHFINLMLITQELQHFKGASPGSIVLNPDLMGMVQQQNLYQCDKQGHCHLKGPTNESQIQVNQALSKAYHFVTQHRDWTFTSNNHEQVTIEDATPLQVLNRVERGDYKDQGLNNGTDILQSFNEQANKILNAYEAIKQSDQQFGTVPQFNNTFKGWIQANNWIINTMGPDITFGWQENVWNPGSATWIHQTISKEQINQHISQPTLKLWHQLAIYNGRYQPDFLVFDKYERDPLGQMGYIRAGWAWNARDWDHYMTYVKQMSEGLKQKGSEPVMLWQIPGGHLQLQNDVDTRNGHGATAPDYFLGSTSRLHTNLDNLRNDIASINLPKAIYNCQNETCQLANYLKAAPNNDTNYNWHQDHLKQLKQDHVFSVLWGGGSTTSVGKVPTYDGGWLADKVNHYEADPENL